MNKAAMTPVKCLCCDDTKVVEDIDGKMRPCSRCQNSAFSAWSLARRPRPEGGAA